MDEFLRARRPWRSLPTSSYSKWESAFAGPRLSAFAAGVLIAAHAPGATIRKRNSLHPDLSFPGQSPSAELGPGRHPPGGPHRLHLLCRLELSGGESRSRPAGRSRAHRAKGPHSPRRRVHPYARRQARPGQTPRRLRDSRRATEEEPGGQDPSAPTRLFRLLRLWRGKSILGHRGVR
jgi:hypothetical protein